MAVKAGMAVDVLLATVDHHGHGFFAIVERIINQILHARKIGLEPYAYVGPLIFREPSSCGQGVWSVMSP